MVSDLHSHGRRGLIAGGPCGSIVGPASIERSVGSGVGAGVQLRRNSIPPLHGALLKNEQDIMLFERLAFMARRQGG